MKKVELNYVTDCLMSAVDEINISLNELGIKEKITEEDLISSNPTKHEDDWFDDCDFIFEHEFRDEDASIIKEKF